MNRSIALAALLLAGTYGIFAEKEAFRLEFNPLAVLAAADDFDAAGPEIPANIHNNQYYQESLRLTNLAEETYEAGDYDAAAQYAAEAIRNAQLSDEYVAVQLKIKAANDAIAAARSRLEWAVAVSAPDRYPDEFAQGQAFYDQAITERSAEQWDEAVESANQVLFVLADVQEPPPEEPPEVLAELPPEEELEEDIGAEIFPELLEEEDVLLVEIFPEVSEPDVSEPEVPEEEEAIVEFFFDGQEEESLAEVPEEVPAAVEPVLPAQYTVRPWALSRDCFWNIAERSWVYGDPSKWNIIYEANRSRLPDADNPNLITPGIILDIPSIQGEIRQGMWDASTEYPPLQQ
ncbi:MAG: LysM peptidoglycan-binding domain-containing protein [Spirochaetaceae bacterium]|jgi:nucleoid-associated protein YgaU|nr:LysM peptidoglycan-binding domain-containing protein [Spirochaetaceae bacterium]